MEKGSVTKRGIIGIILLIVMAFTITACGGTDTKGDTTTKTEGAGTKSAKDSLVVGAFEKSISLDFYQSTSRVDISNAYMIWDPLFERDPENGKLSPYLVKDYKIIDDTTWEFELKPGIKFHNGNPLNSECIRYTLEEYILNPERKSPQASNFNWIKKVEVVNDLTFRLITEKAYPLALENLNTFFPYDPIWQKEMESKNGREYTLTHANGTGPYKVADYQTGEKLVLVKNDNYWVKDIPKIKNITVRCIPENSTRLAELLGGGIDEAQWMTTDDAKTMEQNPNIQIIEKPILRIFFWQFNTMNTSDEKNKPFLDPRVRKAIWYAIDRDTIVKEVFGGHYDLLDIPLNPILSTKKDMQVPKYDLQMAKKLLAEAGYPNGGFELPMYPNQPAYTHYCEAVLPYLEAVGIKGVIKDYAGKWNELQPMIQGAKIPGVFVGSWGNYNIYDPDATWSYFFMYPEGSLVMNQVPEINQWLHDARETLDQKKRDEIYQKVQQKLVDEALMIPVWVEHAIYGVNKDLSYVLGNDQVPRYRSAYWKK